MQVVGPDGNERGVQVEQAQNARPRPDQELGRVLDAPRHVRDAILEATTFKDDDDRRQGRKRTLMARDTGTTNSGTVFGDLRMSQIRTEPASDDGGCPDDRQACGRQSAEPARRTLMCPAQKARHVAIGVSWMPSDRGDRELGRFVQK